MTATLLKFQAPARREPEWAPLRQCVGRDTHRRPRPAWQPWLVATVCGAALYAVWLGAVLGWMQGPLR